MLHISNLDRHVDAPEMVVIGPRRFNIGDVRVDLGNPRADVCQNPLPVFHLHRQPHDIARRIGGAVPLNVDAPLRIVQKVRHVRTDGGVHRYTFAARNVANDFFTADRIATTRAHDHQIVDAAHFDPVLARARSRRTRGGAEYPANHGRHTGFRRLLLQLILRDQPGQEFSRLNLAVPDLGKYFIGRAVFRGHFLEDLALKKRRGIQIKSAGFFLEQLAAQIDTACALFALNEVLDLAARPRGDDEVEPVSARLVAAVGHDLDDVAVAQAGAERHHLAVHARADALMADVSVNGVGEIDRRGAARKGFHLPFRREDVDLFGIQIDFQVLNELVRVANFLLHFEKLADPLEVALVALIADAPFLVFPVGRDAFFRMAVHLLGANLHFEGKPALADDRRVQRLVAVRPRHRNEVLDAARDRRPRLMDDAERCVAVLHAIGDDAQRDEIVDLVELDSLALQLLIDAVQPLQPAVDADDRDLGLAQLRGNRLLQIFNLDLGGLSPAFDLRGERLVPFSIEILEGQFLEFIFDLAHPEAVGNRRVNVERLLRRLLLPIVRHVLERAHVVQAIGQLHENDADVVHHREQHLAEAFGLPLFARGKRDGADGADFGDALDHMRDLGAEMLLNLLDRRQGVFDDVVQQPGGDGDRVEPHVGENIRNLEGVDQVRFP